MKFYCTDKETVLGELGASAEGLTSAEAQTVNIPSASTIARMHEIIFFSVSKNLIITTK